MRSLATELSQASKQFRLCQKEFLHSQFPALMFSAPTRTFAHGPGSKRRREQQGASARSVHAAAIGNGFMQQLLTYLCLFLLLFLSPPADLRAQEVVGEQFLSAADGVSRGVSLEDAVDLGLTEGQAAELALMEQHSNSREKEIIRIAQSVNQLAQLFRELNELVIEQGTVLDRIDYNVEQSLVKIQRGVKDLDEAEKESKKALTMKCIVILALIVFFLLIVFIWRKSS
jgi:hypothetical protein